MKGILVRREKSKELREKLISGKIEFYEETKNFHTLFLFPGGCDLKNLHGKLAELIDDENIESIPIKGESFKIDANRDVIDIFAPKFIEKGLKVKLENPEITLEIHRWGSKFLVSVF